MAPVMDIYMVVALSFAVFAAIAAIGTSLVLGIGFERVRAGLEKVKESMERINKQTGYFSDAIYQLDKKVDSLDKVQEHMATEHYVEKKRVDELIQSTEQVHVKRNEASSQSYEDIDDFMPRPIELSIKKVDNEKRDFSNVALFLPKDEDIRLV